MMKKSQKQNKNIRLIINIRQQSYVEVAVLFISNDEVTIKGKVRKAITKTKRNRVLECITQALEKYQCTLKDIDSIIVLVNESSFTAVRLAVATVNVFVYTHNIKAAIREEKDFSSYKDYGEITNASTGYLTPLYTHMPDYMKKG